LATPAATWTNVADSNWSLTYNSSGEIPIKAGFICSCTTIAETSRTFDGNGDIDSSEIKLNTNKSFSDTTQTTGAYKDYETVMLHEMGHLTRLGHEALNGNSPMYATINDDEEKRNLAYHDKAALAGQY
jgi:hypothetical protein